MSDYPEPSITVNVDVTNPGQFFACCGLLELADCLWPGAEGWFESSQFCIHAADGELSTLIDKLLAVDLEALDPDSETKSPIRLGDPFAITLDWWADHNVTGGKAFKVWAGRMSSVRIAAAMKAALADALASPLPLFDYCAVVYDPDQTSKKVEPFYFDARRGENAKAVDIGFSPDAHSMNSAAYPAVEFLCLVGLQRYRPATTARRRVFNYHAWTVPLSNELAPAAISGCLAGVDGHAMQFENGFRTDQKKHKSFLPATPLGDAR